MSQDDDLKKRKKRPLNADDEADSTGTESGGSDAGGKSGQIEFKDFVSNPERFRDDLLPADEKKRLLIVHRETHEIRVKKQKELRDQRSLVKEGKVPLDTYKQGLGSGMNSNYKVHPISFKAQFSGMDRQTNYLPTENVAETNPEMRNDLEYQYQLRHQLQLTNAPQFNPKPQYR